MADTLTTRDAILDFADSKIESLTVKAWDGCTVMLRTLTGADRASLLKHWEDPSFDKGTLPSRFAARALCDKKGERLFKDSEWRELDKKSAGALDEIVAAGFKQSGLDDEAIEELRGNSSETQSESSG